MSRFFCFVAAVFLSTSGSAFADVVEIGPADDLRAAIGGLEPGDELVLGGGMYTLTARLGVTVVGTEAAPIVIRAKDGERPHLHRPNADQNIIDIDRGEHVVFRGIEFSGGSAGFRMSDVRFLTLEDCEIHDTNDVAVRANDTGAVYESLTIRRNHIHHTSNTGEGMYLGCNSNGCQMTNSLIEGNYIHHTDQTTQGDGIEIKEGSYGNVVRDNVIHDTNYPCILTYSTVGNGAANIIERNVMWNCGDHGIQSAADAVIRNNIILSSGNNGIAMQPHQAGAPDNLVVVHNTVLHADNDAINLSGGSRDGHHRQQCPVRAKRPRPAGQRRRYQPGRRGRQCRSWYGRGALGEALYLEIWLPIRWTGTTVGHRRSKYFPLPAAPWSALATPLTRRQTISTAPREAPPPMSGPTFTTPLETRAGPSPKHSRTPLPRRPTRRHRGAAAAGWLGAKVAQPRSIRRSRSPWLSACSWLADRDGGAVRPRKAV